MAELPTLDSPHESVRRRAYGYQRSAKHVHQGIDLPAQEGTPVFAAVGGEVVHAYNQYTPGFSGYGKVVVVHAVDGTHQLYAHLKRPLVSAGDVVSEGALIGEVGKTGFTSEDHYALLKTGPHLHFEVSPDRYPKVRETQRFDPVPYLVGGGHVHPLARVRLAGDGPVPEPVPTSGEGSGSAARPFVAPAVSGSFLQLQGLCPHCRLPFSCVGVLSKEGS